MPSLRWWVSPWSRKLSRNTSKPAPSRCAAVMAHVAGIDAAFPAVQQQHQAARRRGRARAVQAEQAHAVAGVDDVLGGDRAGALQRAQAAAPAHRHGTRAPTAGADCAASAAGVVGGTGHLATCARCGSRTQRRIAATMRSRPARPCGGGRRRRRVDRLEEMHLGRARRLAQQAQKFCRKFSPRLERDHGLRAAARRRTSAPPAAPARRPAPPAGRCARGTGRSRAVAGAAFREHADRACRAAAAAASGASRRAATRCRRGGGRWCRRGVASQPISGQRAISALATKPITRWLCSSVMSIQLTWLATNSAAPGSGVP